MSKFQQTRKKPKRLEQFIIALFIFWTVIVVASFIFVYFQTKQLTLETAISRAIALKEKDPFNAKWSYGPNEIYIESTEVIPPNPFLSNIPERDIVAPSGKKLTLINHAYMIDIMNKLDTGTINLREHLSSFKPIKSENMPDKWETAALKALIKGKKEAITITTLNNKEYLKYMTPLIASQNCLRCHNSQGFQEGKVVGGLTQIINMERLRAIESSRLWAAFGTRFLSWFLAAIGFFFIYKRVQVNEKKRREIEDELDILNTELESRVEERTAELSLTIEKMNTEIFYRIEAEKRNNHLNRVYAVLSDINQAIVRIHDKEELLNTATRIAVEKGKFLLSGIGLFDESTGKVKFESYYGIDEGYSEIIKSFLVSPDYKFSCASRAFQEGTSVFYNDIETEYPTCSFKDDMLKSGFFSVAAFPLTLFEKTIGVIVYYSGEKGFFNKEEMNLLKELAMDISFALQYIEQDKQRIKAVKELRDSEHRYRTFVDTAPYGILVTDLSLNIQLVNNRILELMGINDDNELIGRNSLELIIPEEREYAIESMKKSLETGEIYPEEYTAMDKKGDKFPIEVNSSFLFDDDGNPNNLIILVQDISQRKKSEKALRESEYKFRTIIKTSPFGIVLTSITFKIQYANTVARKLFGFEKDEEYLNRSALFLIAPEERETAMMQLKRRIAEGHKFTVEYNAIRLDGSSFPIEVNGSILFDDVGKPTGLIILFQDITVRKQTELALIEAKEKAEEMNRLKSYFLANMSHELRTPMIGILGFSELLLTADNLETVKEMASMINQSGKRLTETLNLILDFSRFEAEKTKPEFSNFDLVEEASLVVDVYFASAKSKNLNVILLSKYENLYFNSDRKALNTIINNLLNNAVKYTNVGEIIVSIDKEQDESGEWAVFEVSDTGIGISEEKQEIIFEPFRQESEGMSRCFEGTGLGLTIAKKYVEMLGGTISLKSKLGEGSTFTVRLSILTKEDIIKSEFLINKDIEVKKIAVSPEILEKKAILMVEDDEINIRLVNLLLKGKFNVDTVKTGLEAIEKAKEKQYSLILMDINLGRGVNGIYATKEIRVLPNYKNIPIIAMTAYAMKGDKEEFLDGGCTHYVSKPFEIQEFIDLINEIFESNN